MSYCRSGNDSDVYVIGTKEHLECFGAGSKLESDNPLHKKIQSPDYELIDNKIVKLDTFHEAVSSFYTKSRKEMISHLIQHLLIGHKVPQRAIDRLKEEIESEGDVY